MVFKMLSMDDIYKSGIDDDLEEGEIIDDGNESINRYNDKCQSSTLHNYVEDEVVFLSSDKQPLSINNALPISDNLHQSMICLPNQMSTVSVQSKSQDNKDNFSNWKNSPQKCKRSSFKSNKYDRKRRSPSVSSLSSCSCSSCYSTPSSGESKKQLKGDYQSSRKQSKSCPKKKELGLPPKIKKDAYFLSSVHRKESSHPRYFKKIENALRLKKKYSSHHSTAYNNVADADVRGKEIQIVQSHNQSMHYNVPKKKGDFNSYPLSSKDKELNSRESAKVAIGTLDFLKDIKIRDSAKAKVIPGSLGEMLLKNQLKSKLKTGESPNLELGNQSQSHTLLMKNKNLITNIENNQSGIVNLETVKESTGQTEAENDEEDELTLRYKALQSAVKSSNSNSSAYSDLNKVLAAVKATLDKTVKVADSFEMCTKKTPQKIPILGANDAKDNFEFFCDNQTAKDKCELSMIDMEISNDSITECYHSQEDEKSNPKFDTNSYHFSDKMKCNSDESQLRKTISQDPQFPFPIEWAYMIPPPSQPGQPDNNLTSVNSWCFNQNMFMQSMEETAPGQEVSNDLPYQTKVPTLESYNTYTHHYQVPYQSNDASSHSFVSNIEDINSQVDNLGFCYQQSTNQTTQNTELRDGHAEQYQTFMSSVLHNSHPGLFNQKDKYQNLVQIDLKPLGKSQSKNNPIAHSKTPNCSLPNKRKMRRRRRSIRKNLLDGTKSSTSVPPKASIINLSPLKNSTMENNITIDDDEDEDILRAQLLNDMALKNKFLLREKNENEIQNVQVQNQQKKKSLHPPLAVTTLFKKKRMPLKPAPSFSLKQSRKWLKTKESTAVYNASKQTRKNVTKLDIGGRYLDPKNRFYDAPHTDGFSLSKFPPVKPVIISLASSDSDTNEDEKNSAEIKAERDCETVISGIFELIKSCRNSQVKPINTEMEAANRPTPKGVHHLSKERQEEYRKLRDLLLHKNKMIQMKKKTALKANLVKNPHNTSSIPLVVQSESESLNENTGAFQIVVNSQLEVGADHMQDTSETDNYEDIISLVPLQNVVNCQLEVCGDEAQEIFETDNYENIGEQETKGNSTLQDCTAVSENIMPEGSLLINGEPSINIALPLVEMEEIPISQADQIWSPIKEYSDHLYSKPSIEVTESAEGKIVPSAPLLEKNNANFLVEINECPGEKMNVSSQEIDVDDSSSSSYDSSSSSSSSSSSEDSDSECAIDQIEIDLRNKLLQKRQILLTHEQTVCSTNAILKDEQVGLNKINERNALPQVPPRSKSCHQTDDQEHDIVGPFPLNSFSALVEKVGLEQCSSATPPSSEPESNCYFSDEINKEPGLSIQQISSFDFQGNLGVKNKKEDSLRNETIKVIVNKSDGHIIDTSSNFDLDNSASSPRSKATAIALIKSLRDADLKTRIMRGEQKKNLKKQIEEEIKKKDLSKQMFTSRICTLFQEAVMDDNMCQSLFTQMVKLFSQIDNLQSERKEKISALTVTLAKTTKLIHKLEEDIHALTQLQRLRNQVISSDDENPFIPNLNLAADEEQHKGFLLQMNTLRQNLQLNLAQEQLLTKTISNRFNSRPSHRNRTRREFMSRRPAPANSTARKFKVDRRPLSQRQTERSLGIGTTLQGISAPAVLPWIGRQTAKLAPPQRKAAHSGGKKDEDCSPLEQGTSASLLMDDERDKSVGDLGILCPHDLLGRCNDDFCVYQHTSSPGGQVRGDSNVPTASPPSDSHLAPLLLDKTPPRVSSPEPLSHIKTKHPLTTVYLTNRKNPAEEATTSCGENDAAEKENRNDLLQTNETLPLNYQEARMPLDSPQVLAWLSPRKKRSREEESSKNDQNKKVCVNSVKEDSVEEEIMFRPEETSSTSIHVSCPNSTEITTDNEVTKTGRQEASPSNSMPCSTRLRRKRCRPTARSKRLRKTRIRSRRPVRISLRIQEKLHKY